MEITKITAIKLTRQGKYLIVEVETDDGWFEVIRELDDGTTPISHICEKSGLKRYWLDHLLDSHSDN